MPAPKDYGQAARTGAKVRKVSARKSRFTLVADRRREPDAKACPSLKHVRIFTVEADRLSAQKASVLDVPRCQG
jgi:hypothetical protein